MHQIFLTCIFVGDRRQAVLINNSSRFDVAQRRMAKIRVCV